LICSEDVASPLERRLDLTDERIDEALASREATDALLVEMARVARPRQGATKILVVLARAAAQKCAWLEGPLLVQIAPAGRKTELRVAVDRGGGVLEAVFAKRLLDVPFDEFVENLEGAPRAVEPLRVYRQGDRIVLAPGKRQKSLAAMPRLQKVLDFSALEKENEGEKKR
jgi:hypothetical protein